MTGIESMHVWPENNGCEKQEVKRGCDITMVYAIPLICLMEHKAACPPKLFYSLCCYHCTAAMLLLRSVCNRCSVIVVMHVGECR